MPNKRFLVSIPAEQHERLRELAHKRRVSMAAVVREALGYVLSCCEGSDVEQFYRDEATDER